MKLRQLILGLADAELVGDDIEIGAVVEDSREVESGDVFVAVVRPGVDGHRFVDAAIAKSAAAIVVERKVESSVPQVIVPSTALALGEMASARAGHGRDALRLVGVTGTNGKTTTSYLIETILQAAGERPGVIGTVNYRFAGTTREAPYTTPTPTLLHNTLGEMRDAGCQSAVMETSSAALAMSRLAGVKMDVAVFTNFTQDHLDLHGSMEAYRDAKALLFSQHLKDAGVAVINVDDPMGEFMAKAAGSRRVLRVSAQPGNTSADVFVVKSESTISGVTATLHTPRGELTISSDKLIGHYNVSNLAVAVAVGEALQLDAGAMVRGIAEMAGVPGRVERVENAAGLDLLVDYAHTPDALANVLSALKPLCRGRLICVFGCGGDRDPGKRPKMGAEVSAIADLAVITSDNPRTEDPQSIIDMIRPAVSHPFYVDLDRRTAIRAAVAAAEPGDIVLIAGKGHEDYQIQGTTKIHFDDREEAAKAAQLALPARFSLADITRITGGSSKATSGEFSRVIIDGRQGRPGDLYVAIVGETHDGHSFLEQAAQAGVSGALVARGRTSPALPCIEVDDPRLALGQIAAFHSQRWQQEDATRRIVGITGSSGKTTVKAMIAAALGPLGVVHSPLGSLNNETGVPLTLLGLKAAHRFAVVEMGMRGLGQIEYLAKLAKPDVGVVVNAGTAHLSELGSRENILRAKAEMYTAMPKSGVAIYPAHQDGLASVANDHGPALSFSATVAADVQAISYQRTGPARATVTLRSQGSEETAHIPIPGPHTAGNAACAIAAAIAAGVPFADAARALANTRVPPMRGEVRLIGGRQVLVDCYNANPDSVAAGLASIAETQTAKPVAILGDMLELGASAPADHEKVGALAASLGVSVVCLGHHASDISRGVTKGGGKVTVVETPRDAAQAAWDQSDVASWILVKASRGARLERAVAALHELANKDRG